jgi:hypothetical protein
VPSICCPLCQSGHHRVISRFAGAYSVRARNVICQECGFLFRHDPWGEEQATEFQRKLADCSETDGDGLARKQGAMVSEERSAKRRLRWVRAYVPPPARVLGAGPGSGVFAEVARVVGFDATGIECGAQLGDLEGTDQAAERFDVVALFSYLECVPDLHEALAMVRQLLTSRGLLIVEVPDTMSLTGRPKDQLKPEHNWHFTNRTLGLLLAREGLPPVDVIERDTGEEHVLFAATRKNRVPDPDSICIKNPLEYQRVLAHLQEARRNSGLTPGALVRDAVSIALGPWLGMRAFAALRSLRNGVAGRTGRLYRTAFG